MLYRKYIQDLSKHLEAGLTTLVKQKKVDVDPKAAARDLHKLNFRIDMSKSAARLRRQLYRFVRSPLQITELIALGPDGYEVRYEETGPVVLGDIYLDQFRLVRLARAARVQKGEPEQPALPVLVLRTYLDAISKAMRGGFKYPSDEEVGVLLSLHLSETAQRVRKASIHKNIPRHFGVWRISEPSPDDVDAAIKRLLQYGFITDEDPTSYRLMEEVGWQF